MSAVFLESFWVVIAIPLLNCCSRTFMTDLAEDLQAKVNYSSSKLVKEGF